MPSSHSLEVRRIRPINRTRDGVADGRDTGAFSYIDRWISLRSSPICLKMSARALVVGAW